MAISKRQQKKPAAVGAERVRSARPVVWIWALAAALLALFLASFLIGRTVEVPKNIERIAVSGPLAQIVLFALAPDKLVGIANAWDGTAAAFFDEKYYNLPELGQLYGGKGEMNLESLLTSGAQVVIDVGEPKDTIVEDLDAL